MTNKIDTFEKLHQELIKLDFRNIGGEVDDSTKKYHIHSFFIESDMFNYDVFYCFDREIYWIQTSQGDCFHPATKDPQKIFDVIQSLKRCEDE